MINLKDVTKVFDARGIAGLHKVSFEVEAGSVVAIMGPNGCGKTTLLNLIAGDLIPDSGTIKTHGKIHLFRQQSPAPEINVQKFLISSITLDIDEDKKIQQSRDMAALFEFTFQLKQTIGQLSAGQLRKVLMAAELINQPEILFLDEPFVHLDPMSRKDILELLFEYIRQRNSTVLWVTHEKDEALRFADRIGLIQHGKLEQFSMPIEILQSPRNLFVAQFFGQQNFLKISQSNGEWITDWGRIKNHLTQPEGYLVVPPTAWSNDPNSALEIEILKIYPQDLFCVFEAQSDGRRLKISWPLATYHFYQVGQRLRVSPDLTQCMVIPL